MPIIAMLKFFNIKKNITLMLQECEIFDLSTFGRVKLKHISHNVCNSLDSETNCCLLSPCDFLGLIESKQFPMFYTSSIRLTQPTIFSIVSKSYLMLTFNWYLVMLYFNYNLFQSLRVGVLLLLPAGLQILTFQGPTTYPYNQHHHLPVHHDHHLPVHQDHPLLLAVLGIFVLFNIPGFFPESYNCHC